MSPKTYSFAVKILLLLWAGFWAFFVVASEIAEPASLPQKLAVCLGGVAFFAGSAFLGIRFRHFGGVVLFVEGISLLVANLAFLHNPPTTEVFVIATLALPPLLVGRLLLTENPLDGTRFV
jgi:hypothetical protein